MNESFKVFAAENKLCPLPKLLVIANATFSPSRKPQASLYIKLYSFYKRLSAMQRLSAILSPTSLCMHISSFIQQTAYTKRQSLYVSKEATYTSKRYLTQSHCVELTNIWISKIKFMRLFPLKKVWEVVV